MGQIAGPHRRPAAANPDIDIDFDVATLHMLGHRGFIIAGHRSALSGNLDAEGTEVFGNRMSHILDGGERYVLLDFSEVNYINSSGLHILILVAQRVAGSGGTLVVAGVREHLQKVLKISGLASILTLRPTKAEALAFFPQEIARS